MGTLVRYADMRSAQRRSAARRASASCGRPPSARPSSERRARARRPLRPAAKRRAEAPRVAWTDEALDGAGPSCARRLPVHGRGLPQGVGAAAAGRCVRTSKGRVLRLMREAGLRRPDLAVGRRRRTAGARTGSDDHHGERPDEMWGTDATSCLTTREGNATVFIAVDHCTQASASASTRRDRHALRGAGAAARELDRSDAVAVARALPRRRPGLREHFDGYEADLAAGTRSPPRPRQPVPERPLSGGAALPRQSAPARPS